MRGARAIATVIAIATTSGAAIGAPRGRTPPRTVEEPTNEAPRPTKGPREPSSDLRSRFGVERATELVRSGSEEDLLRGIARASAIGTSDAIALVASVAGASDARVRIAAARGLAAYADQGRARDALFLIVTSDPPHAHAGERDDEERDARFELARTIAATALARSKDGRAGEKLAALARADAAGSRIAADALVGAPPSGATTAWTAPMTPGALDLARRTGDLRALEPALEAARGSDRAAKAAAIEALGALGDARVVSIAQKATSDGDARVRIAAVTALVTLNAPGASDALAKGLSDATIATRLIPLAREVHAPDVTRALASWATTGGDPAARVAAIDALASDPSDAAIETLSALVADPLLGANAADALARSPNRNAMRAIASIPARLGSDARARRIAARAYVVRASTRGERSDAMAAAIASLSSSHDGKDRALAALARIAIDGADFTRPLADADARVRRAAALAMAARDDDDARDAMLARLAIETDAATRIVLARALAHGDPGGAVPTRALLDCARAGGADAPMCALAFAARATASQSEEIDALLASNDPIVRAHVARGLAWSSDPSRAGRLASAAEDEPSALVRIAIASSLAAMPHDSPSARASLDFSSRFDPDARVRAIAARALAGAPAVDLAAGPRGTAWLHLVDVAGSSASPGGAPWSAALLRADGLAVPIVFDDDGDALVPGVPAGEARLVLAPRVSPAYSKSR